MCTQNKAPCYLGGGVECGSSRLKIPIQYLKGGVE